MKKIFFILSTMFSCLMGALSLLALLGTGAHQTEKLLQSSLNSAISYGVKKQTGKTPLEHAVNICRKCKILRKSKKSLVFRLN